MTKQIHFELVSPEQKLVSEPVHMAVIPGVDGELGVGAEHAAFVVALKTGVVRLYSAADTVSQKIFIAGGFADITGDHCSVLAEEAVNVNDLDKADLEAKHNTLVRDLESTEGEVDRTRLRAKLSLVEEKLKAIAA